jgi:TPR repeat protein
MNSSRNQNMDSWKSGNRYDALNFQNILLLASKGDPDAQYSLGVMYSKGVGIEKNDVLAHYWYWEATKKGHSLAQSVVGKMCIEKEKFLAERQSKLAFMLFCADNKELDKDVLSILWNKLKSDEDRIDELRKYTRLALDKLK